MYLKYFICLFDKECNIGVMTIILHVFFDFLFLKFKISLEGSPDFTYLTTILSFSFNLGGRLQLNILFKIGIIIIEDVQEVDKSLWNNQTVYRTRDSE